MYGAIAVRASIASAALATALGICLTLTSQSAAAHGAADAPHDVDPEGRAISFPDTADYLTLTLDPHTHSVFSDGHVWPRIRVGEALRDDLDALAITEHLEWQPHRADIPHPDRNRAFAQALQAADGSELIVINGSEITRDMPIGHINALFLNDANALIRKPENVAVDDPRAYYRQAGEWSGAQALAAAGEQGAFVFWNHPYWLPQKPDGMAEPTPFHRDMFGRGLIHGIEVANGADYSEEAFAVALAHDLTIIGTSDVHELIDWDYAPHNGGHRPVTLVLAEARTEAAIRAALFERRTVAWFRNLLIGRGEHLVPIVERSVTITEARYQPDTEVLTVTLRNVSDARFLLENTSPYTFMEAADLIEVPPHASISLQVKTPGENLERLELPVRVRNALTAPKQHPVIVLTALVARQ